MKASELTSGAVIGVGTDREGYAIEATLAYKEAFDSDSCPYILLNTLEFEFPFAVEADQDIPLRY